jgi:integrase
VATTITGNDEEHRKYITNSRHDIQEKLRPMIGNDIRCGECYKKLASLDDKTNAYTLIKYCLQYKREADIADSTLTTALFSLLRFAHKVNKPFTGVTRDDVLVYLENMKVGNKWKRTYTLFSITVTRFFKWLYSPEICPKERPKPPVVVNLGRVKFDKKTYKNKDIWTLEDNEVFFKYCPDPKIKCYHGIAVDTGARPHEILGLKIEDIVWPPNGAPPIFVVSGKTGSRSLTSLRYHRYIRE